MVNLVLKIMVVVVVMMEVLLVVVVVAMVLMSVVVEGKTSTTNFETLVVATVVGRIAKHKCILGGAGCGGSGCNLVVVVVGEVV